MHIVLVEPEIPGNTGSIARVCAGTDTTLHLVGRLGFSLEDRYLKRAGLDYWPSVKLFRHETLDDVLARHDGAAWFLSTHATRAYTDVTYGPDDLLVFGCETKGLAPAIRERFREQLVRIPVNDNIRSLNLANAASIVLFEALRQTGWR
jgi:tRNA (cytidine/uridine-2'-O-)-methyltransferase